MYGKVALLSIIIRNFILPNPFESHEYGILINLAFEPILWIITYFIVSLFYEKGTTPALGSFLYLFFYCVHVGLIYICGQFNFNYIAIGVIAGLYIAVLTLVSHLVSNLRTGTYY